MIKALITLAALILLANAIGYVLLMIFTATAEE